ncbi:MAG: TonB-dependent receptor [Sphingopyxis sp.]|nr:TonB-dependent receptor [Sphingopyxis sp.]
MAVALPSTTAYAQETAAPTSSGALPDDIVVTASKRSELLSKTPIALTVLTPDALDDRGASRVEDLTTSIPNTQLFYVATGGVQLSIRGVSTNQNNEFGNPAAAFHINGVYEPRPEGINGVLYDVERVEVLRGPQGTLYGRNATVGSINVITAIPKNELEAAGDISYGNFNDLQLRGMVNVPVSDTFAVRAAVLYHSNDGYQHAGDVGNYAKADEIAARITALWRPSDSFSWQIEADYFRNQGVPQLAELSVLPAGTKRFRQEVDTPGFVSTRAWAVRSRMELNFAPDWSLSYVAGYGKLKGRSQYDMDGTDQPLHINRYIRDQDHWSHELNLSYDSERLKVLAGAFYFKERPDTLLNQDNGVFDFRGVYPNLTYQNESYAFFGQATYSLTNAVRVTGGIRYSHDRSKLDRAVSYFCPAGTEYTYTMDPPDASCGTFGVSGPRNEAWDKINWKVGIDADLGPTTLAYATVSTGYKAGVLVVSNVVPPARPETAINYEVGIKTRLFNDHLQLNASAFWMDYKDLQVSTLFAPLGSGGIVEGINNVGKARSRGVEIEYIWAPTSDDRISGFVSYLDAKYLRYPDANDYQLDPDFGVLTDNSGNRLTFAPKWSGRVSYSHTFHIGEGTLVPMASLYYQTAIFLRPFNLAADRQKGYTKSDFTLTYNAPDERYSVEAFVHNIENKKVATMQFNYELPVLRYYSEPRTYGVRVGFKF